MRSIRPLPFLFLAAALCVTLPASAAIYQWKDSSGKTVISDHPPEVGVQVQKQYKSSAPPPTDAKQPTLAEREAEFRKRQQETQENAEKAEKEEQAAAQKKENCDAARRQIQALESGERIALRDAKGERYYMDDTQRAQEIAKAKRFLESKCQ
jgi:hypothetical protein